MKDKFDILKECVESAIIKNEKYGFTDVNLTLKEFYDILKKVDKVYKEKVKKTTIDSVRDECLGI